MSENIHSEAGLSIDGEQPITNPSELTDAAGVRATTERLDHDERDHCGVGTIGWAVTDVVDEQGRHLLLVNEDVGIALLPNEPVEPGGDWASAAREAAAGDTGVSAELDAVLAVRTVDHLRPGEDDPHLRTHRLVFRASPVGGEFHECKRSADNGSDRWRADWFETLPEGVSPAPEGGPRADLALALE